MAAGVSPVGLAGSAVAPLSAARAAKEAPAATKAPRITAETALLMQRIATTRIEGIQRRRQYDALARSAYTTAAVPNLFDRGKPSGRIRPACARSPSQSFRSVIDRLKVRPDESTQVSPSALAKTRTSATPPSL